MCMKLRDNIRLYSWLEFLLWFIILCICIFAFRIHNYEKTKQYESYQIFMQDADGMIIGSPVKYLGVQIGYIKDIKLLSDKVFVRFVVTEENVVLPKGVVASVEFNGLGGSKSLELYAPDENNKTDKLIVVRDPRRLNASLLLINEMFTKIDSIGSRITNFGDKVGVISDNKLKVEPELAIKNVNKLNNFVEDISQKRIKFKNKWKGTKDE